MRNTKVNYISYQTHKHTKHTETETEQSNWIIAIRLKSFPCASSISIAKISINLYFGYNNQIQCNDMAIARMIESRGRERETERDRGGKGERDMEKGWGDFKFACAKSA